MALWRVCFSIFHKVTSMIIMMLLILMIMTHIYAHCRAKQVESVFDASESWSNLWTQTRVVPDKIPEVIK